MQCLVEETGFKEQKTHAHHANKDAQKVSNIEMNSVTLMRMWNHGEIHMTNVWRLAISI